MHRSLITAAAMLLLSIAAAGFQRPDGIPIPTPRPTPAPTSGPAITPRERRPSRPAKPSPRIRTPTTSSVTTPPRNVGNLREIREADFSNLSYPISSQSFDGRSFRGQTVRLSDGVYPPSEVAECRPCIELDPNKVRYGDLTDDDLDEAVILLDVAVDQDSPYRLQGFVFGFANGHAKFIDGFGAEPDNNANSICDARIDSGLLILNRAGSGNCDLVEGYQLEGGHLARVSAPPELIARYTPAPPVPPPVVTVFGPARSIDLGNNVLLELVQINSGVFSMGSSVDEPNQSPGEQPLHPVTISRNFYVGKYEITQAQWKAVMGTTVAQLRDKRNPSEPLYGEGPNYPIYFVTWPEAQEFVKRLNTIRPNDGVIYRLPTEAEWEFAARAGTIGPYAGDLNAMAWHKTNSGTAAHPVGQKHPNVWGLYDMHGNVSEWCEDWFGGYERTAVTDPTGLPGGYLRIMRGGSWYVDAVKARSAYRSPTDPTYRNNNIGLRVVAIPK